MSWYIDLRPGLPCQNIVRAIVFLVEDAGSHKGPNLSISIDLTKLLTISGFIIVHIDYVERSATLVLLASLIDISFEGDAIILELVVLVHLVEALLLPLESLLA